MRDLPTRTVTFLFTDIEGSTRLLQQVGEHYASFLEACRSLLRAAFLELSGHEVDTQGDVFFVAVRLPAGRDRGGATIPLWRRGACQHR